MYPCDCLERLGIRGIIAVPLCAVFGVISSRLLIRCMAKFVRIVGSPSLAHIYSGLQTPRPRRCDARFHDDSAVFWCFACFPPPLLEVISIGCPSALKQSEGQEKKSAKPWQDRKNHVTLTARTHYFCLIKTAPTHMVQDKDAWI